MDPVRASRAGHSYHERWAARFALQLVLPKNDLHAIALEGLSTNETTNRPKEADEIADLTLYFGTGDNFATCRKLTTFQFKYKSTPKDATSSFLKETIEKFADTLLGYESRASSDEIDNKVSFSVVTNVEFSNQLWEAIRCIRERRYPKAPLDRAQYNKLVEYCQSKGVEAGRLFRLIDFRASSKGLAALNGELRQTLCSWSAGADSQARLRLLRLMELISEKAGLSGKGNNLIKRQDVLDILGCEHGDLFPADEKFVDTGNVIEREALSKARQTVEGTTSPIVIFADGGVGKTVFVRNIAQEFGDDFETVIFDCFGGGSYRIADQSRHLPKTGLLQIINDLAGRGLCDLQLPSDGDRYALIKAARKRLGQAAETIKTQSGKKGVLVIIDAADNAQIVANERNEDAFPKLLLASLSREPIDGVKLMLTARTHRKNAIIGQCDVECFKLCTFTRNETQKFLKSRRPGLTKSEFAAAFVHSRGNARVLKQLVKNWDLYISKLGSKEQIHVEDFIDQYHKKIRQDLFLAGWSDEEAKQFFTAVSLLPPPIPLDAIANLLGWPEGAAISAITDLAPIFKIEPHGVIFRDEPTETFIREIYASETKTQHEIADRLFETQNDSIYAAYAAEALPGLLVAINDSFRAYELSESQEYPDSIQTEYGRGRLKLLRSQAAFSLAVKEWNLDRVLRLTMRLAQVTSANAKGDQFIRRSPGLAVLLGDQHTSRRLFQDRSGWQGERHARLTVAFAFLGEFEEAEVHRDHTIGWINWHDQKQRDDKQFGRSGPSASDYAAIVFFLAVQQAYTDIYHIIKGLNFRFILSVWQRVIALVEQYDILTRSSALVDLVKFASSKGCRSFALQVSLLARLRFRDFTSLKRVARIAGTNAQKVKSGVFKENYYQEGRQQANLSNAALAALIHNSRNSAARIISEVKAERVSRSCYSERHGPFGDWPSILTACTTAWSAGHELRFHHLMPSDVQTSHALKSVTDRTELIAYLEGLKERNETTKSRSYRDDCKNIAIGSELIILLTRPIQDAVLARRGLTESDFHKFMETWAANIRLDINWREVGSKDRIAMCVGSGFAQIFLRHTQSISENDAKKLIDVLNRGNFMTSSRLDALVLLAQHTNLSTLTGRFARKISEEIGKDNIQNKHSEQYLRLAEALLPMSKDEAKEYFRQGISRLDQVGAYDFNIFSSLLQYVNEQRGGPLSPALGHRLMNLCQAFIDDDPDGFDWALFGSAAAQSIGPQAIYKLVRWEDQNVASLSYGLPQLVCFLTKKGHLDARRAAFVLLLCKNNDWHNWNIGSGLRDIFKVANGDQCRTIFRTVVAKLKMEYPFGVPKYLSTSIRELLDGFPDVTQNSGIEDLGLFRAEAHACGKEGNKPEDLQIEYISIDRKAENELACDRDLERVLEKCNLSSARSIDDTIRILRKDREPAFNTMKFFIKRLCQRCTYRGRVNFVFALCESEELDFYFTVEIVKEIVELWEDSSANISSKKKAFIQKIFECKSSNLFNSKYIGLNQEVERLVEFSGDANFVFKLVLGNLAKEKVELSCDVWLQLATRLCTHTSPEASLDALSEFLSGRSVLIRDEVGEGAYRACFAPPDDQSRMIAELTWHLLGNEDAFVRWVTARSVSGLVGLGLHTDIKALLRCYDRKQIKALVSENTSNSFLNAQQWLLMGLARACLNHGKALDYLKDWLETLGGRDDIHAINKIHIVRCLHHISGNAIPSPEISNMMDTILVPTQGYKYKERDILRELGESQTNFNFDYDFEEIEISGLARLFGITKAEAADAVACEIRKKWPEITSLNRGYFFRYYEDHRYENFRASVQKHAMLSVATTFSGIKPVIRDNDVTDDSFPWVDWLRRNDISFEDGAWLSDRKDTVPAQAKQELVVHNMNGDSLECEQEIFRKVGLAGRSSEDLLPLCGLWQSRDGVMVRIKSALTQRKGVIGRCKMLSMQPYHKIRLPQFCPDGHIDRNTGESEFEPFIWNPERYPIGIDSGDEFATRYAVDRPRLGMKLTSQLELKPKNHDREWHTREGNLALRSQVWGQWRQDQREHREWHEHEGMILWARADWLDAALSALNRSLVFHVDFTKYKSHSNAETQGLRAVYIALHIGNIPRIWAAKKASKMIC